MPTFGDHVLAIVELNLNIKHVDKNKKNRNWKSYSVGSINMIISTVLMSVTLPTPETDVQSNWNLIEYLLVNATDMLAPLTTFSNKHIVQTVPIRIKNKINKRKRLLRLNKMNNLMSHMSIIKSLTIEIKTHFKDKLISNVKRAATGTNGNIWRALKRAKNLVHEVIPNNLHMGGG